MSLISAALLTSTVRELPALPAIVVELIELLERDDVVAGQLASRISHDQALTAKTLRLANSSFYGMPRQVVSLTDAIAVLGLRTVRAMVTAAAVIGKLERGSCDGFDLTAFWRHSIATAVCARAIAQAVRADPEAAFTAGLLHDIGRLVLVSGFAEPYALALAHQRECDAPMLDSERKILGIDHALAGGLMAEHWRFSPVMVEAIRRHHEPVATSAIDLSNLVHVADNIAHALDLSHLEDDAVPGLSAAAWLSLKLTDAQCRQVFHQTEAQTDAVCEALLT
jgi:putative nucleotidyltransferase with HDIG domain